MSRDRHEWYAEESYDCSPVSRSFTVPEVFNQLQVQIMANTQPIVKSLKVLNNLMTKTRNDFVLFPPPSTFDSRVPMRPPHSMAPGPRSHVFDRRGRKRY